MHPISKRTIQYGVYGHKYEPKECCKQKSVIRDFSREKQIAGCARKRQWTVDCERLDACDSFRWNQAHDAS